MILFSAIGGHDPVASFHDGSMLHICRVYRPRKVVLYLSQEMVEREQADGRYTKTLDMFATENALTLEVKLIKREELTQVQLYDVFYQEFEPILRALHQENPNEEILLNIASGTPAMKSALNIIAALSPYPIKAIQVATPTRKENFKTEFPTQYDVASYWERNEDRKEGFENRCTQVQNLNLLVKLQKETILKMVQLYDYNGALSIAKEIETFLSSKAYSLLRFAQYRYMLDASNMRAEAKHISTDFMPKLVGEKAKVFEYVLNLQVKANRREYADFLRAITPVILDLFENCLLEQKQIDLKTYCVKNAKGVYRLSPEKFCSDAIGKEMKSELEKNLPYGQGIKETPYSSYHIKILLDHYCSNQPDLLEQVAVLRGVEQKVRNIAAHEIQSVTEEWILARTGNSVKDILKAMRYLMRKSGFTVKEEDWDSYDRMNEEIKKELYQS